MASEMNRLSDRQWFEWILDAIRSIRLRKHRATLQLICSTIRKRHVFHHNTILARIEQAKACGIVTSYVGQGEISYRAAEENVAGSSARSRKQRPAANLLCIECLKTIEKGPKGNQPEPMSSCERCGISMHDFCSNQSTDGESSVPLSRLVAAGNRWFCEECESCDGCCIANESLSCARACLVECGECMKRYHFQCMAPTVDSRQKLPGIWRCAGCTKPGEKWQSSKPEHLAVPPRTRQPTADRSAPSESELIDGRMEVLKIKLGERVTVEDLALFRQVLMRKYQQEHGNLLRTPSAVQFGRHTIESWYSSPFPQEYAKLEVLHMCEFCLKYMKTSREMVRHRAKCGLRHPPGLEIYRDGPISVFEVSGSDQRLYCQSLCLLTRLFLEDKIVFFAVEPFVFYVMTRHDHQGQHVVGFFSKKKGQSEHNVSCILTLPQHQRQGYGRFLIDFSYLLSRVEQKPGTPEKPLSPLGLRSYKEYWCSTVLSYLWLHRPESLTVADISRETGLLAVDIVYALLQLGFVRYRHKMVDSRRVRLPFLCIDWRHVERHHELRMKRPTKGIQVHEACLRWIPNGAEFNATIRNLLKVRRSLYQAGNDNANKRSSYSCSPVDPEEKDRSARTDRETITSPRDESVRLVPWSAGTTATASESYLTFTPRLAPFSDEEMSLDSVEAFKGTPKSEVHSRLSPEKPCLFGFTPIAPFRRADGAADRLVAVVGSEQPIVSQDTGPPEPGTPTMADSSAKWKRHLNATPLSSLKRSFASDRKRKIVRQLLPESGIQRPKLDDGGDLMDLRAANGWTAIEARGATAKGTPTDPPNSATEPFLPDPDPVVGMRVCPQFGSQKRFGNDPVNTNK